MLTERLALLISADVQGAVRGLNEVGQTAKSQLGEAEKRIDKVGRGFSKVGAGMLTAGAAGAAGLFKLAGAAEESRKVSAQTDAVLASMGDQAGITADHVSDLATSISRKTAVDDELIQSTQNVLLTFGNLRNEMGKGNAIFDRTTQLAVDMSVALGQDMQSSAIQLGKALNDPVKGMTALTRVGVSFTQQQKDQVAALMASNDTLGAQKLILEEVERQFAGSAEAQATASDKLKVALGNLGESIGAAALPAVDSLASGLGTAADKFTEVDESTNGLIGRLAVGATGFSLVGGAALMTAGKIIELNRSLRDADGNLTRGGRAAVTFGKVLGGLAVAGLATETIKWAASLGDVNFEIERAIGLSGQRQVEEFRNKIAEVTEETGQFELSWKAIGRDVGNIFGSVKSDLKWDPDREAKEYFDELLASSLATAEAFRDAAAADSEFQAELNRHGLTQEYLNERLREGAEAQANVATAATQSANIVDAAAGRTAGAIGEVGDAAGDAEQPVKEYTTGIEDAIKPHEALENAIKGVIDALSAQFDPLFAVTDALLANTDAQRSLTDAETEAKEAQTALNEAVRDFGRESPQATEAARRLDSAQRGVEEANRRAGRSALDVTKASTNLAAQMRAGNIDIAAAERQIREWGDQGLITARQAKQMKDELFFAALAAQELDKHDPVVTVTADTSRYWKAISDLYSGAAGVPLGVGDAGGPLIVPQFDKAEGGFIPGPKGKPVFGIAHGGEYVVSNAELDAMGHAGISGATGGLNVTIERMDVRNQPTEETIATELRRQTYLWAS
jgi:hypothetical protein